VLKRSSFKQAVYVRPARVPAAKIEGQRGVIRQVSDAVTSVPKDARTMNSAADEARLWGHVRGLPCARCWHEGRTQVSHSNALIDGKGRGLKAYPWRVAALCVECHAMIDQGKDMSKAERLEAWNAAHRWTIGELFARGLVRPV
jgi:hypothetical protein